MMNRRASSTVGHREMASTGLTATTTVISMPRSNSAKSACSASRFSARSASRTAGSDSLIAAMIRNLWPSRRRARRRRRPRAQVRACVPVPIALPAKDAGMAWNSSDAAP